MKAFTLFVLYHKFVGFLYFYHIIDVNCVEYVKF